MNTEQLFQVALNLESPWLIENVEFPEETKQLEITLDFPRGSHFPCPECGKLCPIHDTQEKTWRHLNFFQYETHLRAKQPRVKCDRHKVKVVNLPWARPGSGFTLLFEALVMAFAQNGMTGNAIARIVGEHDTLIWRIIRHYIEEARTRENFSEVKSVGVDETSKGKGHDYVTVFMDFDQQKILFVTEGKDAKTVTEFKQDLELHHGDPAQIEDACMDLSRAFQAGFNKEFEQVQLTFDQFHLMKIINKAVDDVRKQEQQLYPDLFHKSKYVWLKNEWNLTGKQKEKRQEIFADNRAGKLQTIKAYHLRSVFQDVFSIEDPTEGEAFLNTWYFWATHSRIESMIQAAKTIKAHWDGVVRWFQSKISNGLLEGMNSLIQAAKARARGFRNVEYFKTAIYLVGSKLQFNLPKVLTGITHTK